MKETWKRRYHKGDIVTNSDISVSSSTSLKRRWNYVAAGSMLQVIKLTERLIIIRSFIYKFIIACMLSNKTKNTLGE